MPYGQPRQLANLKPAWKPGAAPKGGRRLADVDKSIALTRKAAPKAAKLIRDVMLDEGQPIALRVRCAEFILNKVFPTSGSGAAQIAGGGPKWLELRFVTPGNPAAAPEMRRITFDPVIDVEGNETKNVGQIVGYRLRLCKSLISPNVWRNPCPPTSTAAEDRPSRPGQRVDRWTPPLGSGRGYIRFGTETGLRMEPTPST